MSGTVYFLPLESEQASVPDKARVFCPSGAVAKDDTGDAFVWMVDKDGRAKKNVVKIIQERDGKIEIASGLSGGDRVIATPGYWQEGQLVKVVE